MNSSIPIKTGRGVCIAITLTFLLRSPATSRAADWPQFRGPDRNGISADTRLPLTWSAEKNIKWKAPLPEAGNSSPVVSGDQVFVTCAEDGQGLKRSLYCFNKADGKQLWVKTVDYLVKEPTHARNPYCGSTPAADAAHVVVWHGSAGVRCYDHGGKELWSRDLGTFRHIWGYASSPVLYRDSVLLNCGPGVNSFVIALSLTDGHTLWKTDEPDGADDHNAKGDWVGSWATPIIAKVNGKDQVLVPQSRHVNAYDPKTGKVLWTCGGTGNLDYADIMLGDGIAVAASGYTAPAIGFRLGGAGDVTTANQLWRVEKNPQRVGSGVVLGKHLYMVNEPGFSCIELLTGREVWKERPAGQTFWASVVSAGDRLYVTSQQGVTYVFAADPAQFRLLATNDIGEGSNSTIAVSDRLIFLRTFKGLYCIDER